MTALEVLASMAADRIGINRVSDNPSLFELDPKAQEAINIANNPANYKPLGEAYLRETGMVIPSSVWDQLSQYSPSQKSGEKIVYVDKADLYQGIVPKKTILLLYLKLPNANQGGN